MKSIGEIEKFDMSQLEKFAADESVKVPEGLNRRLEEQISMLEFLETERSTTDIRRKRRRIWSIAASAAAVACLCIGIGLDMQPKDTFSSPEMAYAHLEQAFSIMSSRMDDCMNRMTETTDMVEKANNIIEKVAK